MVLACSAGKTKLGDKMMRTDVFRLDRKIKIPAIIAAVLITFMFFVASLIFVISSAFKNDSSYKMAVSHIESNAEIREITGEIDGYGFMPSGSLSYSGGYGEAAYTIKVIGSRDTVYVYVEMEKKPVNDWVITHFDYGSQR